MSSHSTEMIQSKPQKRKLKISWKSGRTKQIRRTAPRRELKPKPRRLETTRRKEKTKRAMNLAEHTRAHISGKTVLPTQRIEEEAEAEGPTTRTSDAASFEARSSTSTAGTQEEVTMDQEALEAEAVNKEEDLAEVEECRRSNTISTTFLKTEVTTALLELNRVVRPVTIMIGTAIRMRFIITLDIKEVQGIITSDNQ